MAKFIRFLTYASVVLGYVLIAVILVTLGLWAVGIFVPATTVPAFLAEVLLMLLFGIIVIDIMPKVRDRLDKIQKL